MKKTIDVITQIIITTMAHCEEDVPPVNRSGLSAHVIDVFPVLFMYFRFAIRFRFGYALPVEMSLFCFWGFFLN